MTLPQKKEGRACLPGPIELFGWSILVLPMAPKSGAAAVCRYARHSIYFKPNLNSIADPSFSVMTPL
jgi:hypothetical protein